VGLINRELKAGLLSHEKDGSVETGYYSVH
jgi:hypothetical protein